MESQTIKALADMMADFFADERITPTLPALPPAAMETAFDLRIPAQGKNLAEVFSALRSLVFATPRTATRTFLNQLFGGRVLPATAADMLVALLNNSMYTYKVAGVQVLVEQEVIRKMCACIGFDAGDGTFGPGGSISNLTAMIIARNEQDASIRDKGLPHARYKVYTSDQGHYSIKKSAGILGLGRENVREIATDAQGRMDIRALQQAIEDDLRTGDYPFFINATAGTTVLGAFDPIEEIVQIGRKYKLWVHIDGAWGGTLLLSRKRRHLLRGCAEADSFAWNAHKMMGVPLSASATLLKRTGLLEKHFSEQAGYLFQADDAYNPGTKSIQCGRRNDALKVWAAWQFYGDSGYAQRVDKLFELAAYAAKAAREDPAFELCLEPESMNVCFLVKGKSSEKICERLDREGLMKIGFGRFNNRSYIRLVCVNPELTCEDIDAFFAQIKKVAARL